jgi:hypothetical protein
VDISKLSAAELDELIVRAAERRASLGQRPAERPVGQIQVIINPGWYTEQNEGGSLFQIFHPGFGWLNFVFPPADRNRLLGFLLMQALAPSANAAKADPAVAATPAAPAAGGGGKLH